MFPIIGVVLLFGLVFGSFIISGGNMGVIIEAAPHELMCIMGAGVASFLISNSMTTIKATGGGVGKVFAGPKWKASSVKPPITTPLRTAAGKFRPVRLERAPSADRAPPVSRVLG